MNIIIFTPQGHPQANFVLKRFLEQNSKYVSAIIESTRLLPNRSNFKALYRYIKISGLKYVIPQVYKRFVFRLLTKLFDILQLGDLNNEYFSYKRIIPRIPIIQISDINNPSVIKKIKEYKKKK